MNNETIKPRILSGFLELLPKEQVIFNRMLDKIRTTFIEGGFFPIETPLLELSEVLLAKAGGETEKQIYEVKKGENNLCLRFDHTVPLARYVAEHYGELSFPFKRYAIGKVYRGERPQKGRFREFYQCDIDIIGDEKLSVHADAECAKIAYKLLANLGFKLGEFIIRINNRKILNGFMQMIGVGEKTTEILHIVDKYEKIGRGNVETMLNELELKAENVEKILQFIEIKGTQEEVLEKLSCYSQTNETSVFNEGVAELRQVYEILEAMRMPREAYALDIKTVRGLDYYTGTVYEAYLTNHKEFGAVCSGGRYDNLASYYTTKQLPGVGISLGLTRFFSCLRENNMLEGEYQSPMQVAVIPFGDDYVNACYRLASVLEENRIQTEVYSFAKSFKAKLNMANKMEVPYVILVGEDEVKSSIYPLKDMKSGGQEKLTEHEIVQKLKP